MARIVSLQRELLFNYPVVLLIQRWGAHVGLGLGFGAAAVQIGALRGFTATSDFWFLLIAAISLSISNACNWNSQHIYISRVMDNATKSSSIATMETVSQVLGVVAPFAGGFVGAWFGSGWLLIVSALVTVAAFVPLAWMGEIDRRHTGLMEERVTYSLRNAPRRDLFANFCFNIETAIGTMVWPIYLAIEIKTYKEIGLITALAGVATIVVVIIAGRRGDRGSDRAVLLEGSAASSAIHIARIFVTGSLGILLVSVGYRASLGYVQNAWTSSYYNHAKRHGIPYVMSMEIACDLAYVMLWSLLLVLAHQTSTHTFFVAGFVAAAAAAWGCLAISKQGQLESSGQSMGD